MARAATTTDVFNAIAEPRRREIIAILSNGAGWAVNDVVAKVNIGQPTVSKHLGVLLKVGLVIVTKKGQHRMYRLDATRLKLVHDWVTSYEHYWSHQISRIKQIAERKMPEKITSGGPVLRRP
jgi:DNA-binding transcriptional ArsR family regulator